MNYQFISIEQEGHLAVLTIQRPEQLNALNKATIEELNAALNQLDADDAVRAIILTGSGTKAFVAGADIKEFASFTVEQGEALSREGQRLLFDRVENMTKPVIAAVNGFALGGGLELAMSCHFRYASENAKLGLPEVTLGVIPGYGGTQRLAQLVGKGKAMEMITSANMIPAQEAMQWGLVNLVVPQEELLNKCKEIAHKISNNSPRAISTAITAINAGYSHAQMGMEREQKEFGLCFGTTDFMEGTTAFLEKRKPAFTGK